MFRRVIDGEIELLLLEPRHAEALYGLTDKNRPYLRQWLPWLDNNTSIHDTLLFIDSTRRQYAANNGFQAGIWYRSEIAGVIGYHPIDWPNRSSSLGYWLGESFQGRGIMTRSCRAFLDHSFRSLKLNRIEIRCATDNGRSRAIPERLGFRREGQVREAEWLYERFVDHVVYGLLVREWIPSA